MVKKMYFKLIVIEERLIESELNLSILKYFAQG